MKCGMIRLMALAVLVGCLSGMPLWAAYSGGSGTEGDPYQIATAGDLIALGQTTGDYGKCFVLTADIDLAGQGFSRAVIAWDTDNSNVGFQGTDFSGKFDGKGFMIANLNIVGIEHDYIGLFGKMGTNGKIINLGLSNVTIAGSNYIGGLCGENYYGAISRCYVFGSVAGIEHVGGLCGINTTGALISQCYAMGTVSGTKYVGGLCGEHCCSGSIIRQSYAANAVQANGIFAGGLNGWMSYATVTDSFWDLETSEQPDSAGGLGLTTEQMQDLATYMSAGWDFYLSDGDGVDWYLPADSYPKLFGEVSMVETVVPGLSGLSLSEAEQALVAAGLAAGTLTYEYSLSVDSGKIIRQNLTPGDHVTAGTAVELVISMGLGLAGSGTVADPYQLGLPADWIYLSKLPTLWSGQFILTSDIDFEGAEITPIAPDTNGASSGFQGTSFTGVLEGNGNTISNFTIHGSGQDYVGLIGNNIGTIQNLKVRDGEVAGKSNAGVLSGFNSGRIKQCQIDGMVSGTERIGVLCGGNNGIVSRSQAAGRAAGIKSLGGLCGYNNGYGGVVEQCSSTVEVAGQNQSESVGGLCGLNLGTLRDCYVTGVTTAGSGSKHIGGLCGYNNITGVISGMIENGLAMGPVTSGNGSQYVGGVCGRVGGDSGWRGEQSVNSFWAIEGTGQRMSPTGTGLSSKKVQDMTVYKTADWDFANDDGNPAVWKMSNQGYPILVCEQEITVPATIGMEWEAGRDVMRAVVLYPTVICEVSETAPAGIIVKQSVAGGMHDRVGSPIELTVSIGHGYSGGAGTVDDPYQVGSVWNLITLSRSAADYDKCFVLTADISLEDFKFERAVIAADLTDTDTLFQGTSFSGQIDGDGHVIRHLAITTHGLMSWYTGFLGSIASNGVVKNLGLESVTIRGTDPDTLLYPNMGYNRFLGGLCGWNSGRIQNCYVTGSIGTAMEMGGLCGNNVGIIESSYALCTVYDIGPSASYLYGGFCGTNKGTLQKCYAASLAAEGEPAAINGLYGTNSGTISGCLWDREIANLTEGGYSSTTEAMQIQQTYLDMGWDFAGETTNGAKDLWRMPEQGGYPILSWQSDLVTLPDTAGMNRNQAEAALKPLGLTVVATIEHRDVKLPGYVARQNPPAGRSAVAGTVVRVFAVEPKYSGGEGTAGNPYRIGTAEDLVLLGETQTDYGRQFILTEDIDLSGLVFTLAPIAPDKNSIYTGEFDDVPFSGVLDGKGHRIQGLYIRNLSPSLIYQVEFLGLVGALAPSGRIRNLAVDAVIDYAEDFYYGGVLCGYNNGGRISACQVSGAMIYPGRAVNVGGLCGGNSTGIIEECYSTVDIAVGLNSRHIGGFCGNSSNGTIKHSYSLGKVNGSGFCGLAGTISHCFWDVETSGQMAVSVGTGLRTLPMQSMATYLGAGWDFVGETANGTGDVWHMPYGQAGYPMLWWQKDIPGDIAGGYGVDMADFDALSERWLAETDDEVELATLAEHWLVEPVAVEPQILMGYWPFDADGGDAAGANDGVLAGGAVITADPAEVKRGSGALKLDGIDDLVNCGTDSRIANLPAFSVAMWFKADAISSNVQQLICQRNLSSQLWGLSISGSQSGHLVGYVGAGGGGANTEVAFTPMAGRWTHVVMSYDNLGDRKVRIYVNGVEMPTIQQTAAVGTQFFDPTIPVTIGNRVGGGRGFGGLIDEVRIYRRVLGLDEVKELAEFNPFVAQWTFDVDGADSQGNNPGALANGAAIVTGLDAIRVGAGALKLDGVNDSVDCGTDGSIGYLSTFSVAMWFKADAISSNVMQLICQRNLSAQIWGLSISGSQSGHLVGYVGAAGSGATTEAAYTPVAGQWTHVLMSYDNLGDRKVRLYVNGAETPYVQQTAGAGTQLFNMSIPVTIGDRVGGGRAFGGNIDEVRIYRRVLELTEVMELAEFNPYVAQWTFDSDGTDSQGNNPGALANGAAIVTGADAVRVGAGALKLDGVNDSVDCGTDGSIGYLSTFSVALWFKADAISSNVMQLICQRNLSAQIWGLSISGSQSGHLVGYVGAGGGGATTEAAFTPIAGRWTHVVMSYDNLGDRKVRLYVNGAETPYVQQTAGAGTQLFDMSIPVTIGDRVGGGRAFGGNIDEVRIYRRVLELTEVMELAEFNPYVAQWTFDSDGTDSQGNNPGALANGAAIVTGADAVRVGAGALKLDGIDDLVDCGTDSSIGYLATFSVALWFKADAITGNTLQLIGQRDLSSQMWGLSIWGSQAGHLTGYVGAGGSGATTETVFTPTVGRWHHVVMTYDDGGDRTVRMYVDGVETGTIQQTAAVGTKLFNAAIPVTIGDRVGGGRAFGGGIDEVRIYRRVLTAAEIAALAGA